MSGFREGVIADKVKVMVRGSKCLIPFYNFAIIYLLFVSTIMTGLPWLFSFQLNYHHSASFLVSKIPHDDHVIDIHFNPPFNDLFLNNSSKCFFSQGLDYVFFSIFMHQITCSAKWRNIVLFHYKNHRI